MEKPPPAPKPHTVWAIAFVIVALAGLTTLAGLYVFNALRGAPRAAVEAGREVLGDLRSVAEAFRTGTVRTTFVNYAARVTGGKKLQVAELAQTEVYTRQDAGTVLWGNLQLPSVVVAATVPVEYTYYLDLEDPWSFRLEGDTLVVEPPEIRFNTPALDVSALHFEVRESSLLRDETAVLETLRAGLTRLSRERALDHISLIRETARRQTEEFVATWLSGAFGDAASYRVEVVFPGEPGRSSVPKLPARD